MKLYTGQRIAGGVKVCVDGVELTPDKSQELRDHSPDGFEWGYRGSGPSQLALAILLDLYGDRVAQLYYQDFKDNFIATADQNGFVISSDDVDVWIKKVMKTDEGSGL